ncbi:MAG: hypothetical protein P8J20_07500 [Novosphingobium sp.]|nr:hypothetical protein [Novosphingobium sp.]
MYLFAEEGNSFGAAAIGHLIDLASRDVSFDGPAIIHLVVPPDQPTIRREALSVGFRPHGDGNPRVANLEKVCLGGVVTDENWLRFRAELIALAGLELPIQPPSEVDTKFSLIIGANAGEHFEISIPLLERALSPALFVLKDRPSVIVPIKPRYAESLFQGTQQPSFLDDPQAAIISRKRYFGDVKTYSTIGEGGLMVFYESQDGNRGRGAAIAIARITRRYLAPENAVEVLSQERGVLNRTEVRKISRGKEICVTELDNLHRFTNPIFLADLKAINCADGANLVTARRLDSDALAALIKRAQPHAR